MTLSSKPVPTGLSVETTLEHFVIVSYWVDPSDLKKHLHPRFEPVCLAAEAKAPRSLISVVTFVDRDFRLVACPWIRRSFGQTNYRAYVRDALTGDHVVWFFGTCLDSSLVAVPRHLWKLPWHRGRMAFDCRYDRGAARYAKFTVRTESSWSPARLEITDSGKPPQQLSGFPDLESGLVVLTHPMHGYFHRRDGELGTYRIWHDRARVTQGAIHEAWYPLLARLGLVQEGDRTGLHSVLIQPSIDFTIYLPPSRVPAAPE